MLRRISRIIALTLLMLCKTHISANELIEAIKSKNLRLAIHLIESGFNINETDEFGKTPLHYTVLFSNEKSQTDQSFIALLIKKGANINAQDKFGWTPFHHAIPRSSAVAPILLKNYTVDTNVHTKTEQSLIEFTIKHNEYLRLPYNEKLIELYDPNASGFNELVKNYVLKNHKKYIHRTLLRRHLLKSLFNGEDITSINVNMYKTELLKKIERKANDSAIKEDLKEYYKLIVQTCIQLLFAQKITNYDVSKIILSFASIKLAAPQRQTQIQPQIHTQQSRTGKKRKKREEGDYRDEYKNQYHSKKKPKPNPTRGKKRKEREEDDYQDEYKNPHHRNKRARI